MKQLKEHQMKEFEQLLAIKALEAGLAYRSAGLELGIGEGVDIRDHLETLYSRYCELDAEISKTDRSIVKDSVAIILEFLEAIDEVLLLLDKPWIYSMFNPKA